MEALRRVWDNRLLRITVLMVGWYITSIAAGIYNKAYLNLHPLPVLLTMAQSVADVLCCLLFLYLFLSIQRPKSWGEIRILAILGLVHCVGTALTNWSTLESAASFTHTIKVPREIHHDYVYHGIDFQGSTSTRKPKRTPTLI
jgi:drug/metabolite transporter (DMT)-like permease